MVTPFNDKIPVTNGSDISSRDFQQYLTELEQAIDNAGGNFETIGTADMTGLTDATVEGIPSDATEIKILTNTLNVSLGTLTPRFKFRINGVTVGSGYNSFVSSISGATLSATNGVAYSAATTVGVDVILDMLFTKDGDDWLMSSSWSGGATTNSYVLSASFDASSGPVEGVRLVGSGVVYGSGSFTVLAR